MICALIVATTVAGCTRNTEAGSRTSEPATAASPALPPTAITQPGGATFRVSASLPVKAATTAEAGRHFEPQPAVPGSYRGKTVLQLALAESGETVVSTAAQAKTTDGVTLAPSAVSVLRPDGPHRVSPAPKRGDKPRQTIYAAARKGVIAWMDTSSTELYMGDWRVYVHDGARARLIGDSSEIAPGRYLPLTPHAATPAVGDRAVYWPTARPGGKPDTYTFDVVSRPFDGSGKLRVAATRAGLPAADGTNLYYLRSADFAPGFAQDAYEIHRLSADGRDRIAAAGRLGPGERVSTLTASGGLVTWIVTSDENREAGRLFAWDSRRNQAVEVRLADQGGATVLSSSGRLIAWGNESGTGDAGMYLLDLRAEPRLFRLGEAPGLSYAMVGGGYVGWSEPSAGPDRPGDNLMRVGRWI